MRFEKMGIGGLEKEKGVSGSDTENPSDGARGRARCIWQDAMSRYINEITQRGMVRNREQLGRHPSWT